MTADKVGKWAGGVYTAGMFNVLAQAVDRPPDHGPLYVETNFDRVIVEPVNTVTTLLFVILAVYWFVRLRGQYRRHWFLTAALPVLFVGAVGGTVYHAFRCHHIWLLLDWVPIALLCMATGVYLWGKLLKRYWPLGLLIVPVAFGANMLAFRLLGPDDHHLAIMTAYCVMGSLILVPALGVLHRTRWKAAGLPLAAVVCFGLAILARTADRWGLEAFPFGTHFLWHIFGAAAVHLLAAYLCRLDDVLAAESR